MPEFQMAGPITDAINKIQGTQIKTRKAGLEELKRVLEQNRHATGKSRFNDESWSKLLKQVFQAIEDEKSVLTKKSKTTDDKLLTLVEAFRTVVEHGLREFRRKRSAPAVITHIVQILPTGHGDLVEQLARPYAKILRTFLEYKPHLDHLSEEEWRELVSLCCLGLAVKAPADSSDDGDESDGIAQPVSAKKKQISRSGTPLTMSMSFKSNGRTRTMTMQDIAGNQTVEDFCACLALLMSVAHQPILTVAGPTIAALLEFLDTATQSSFLQTQEHAFSVLNSLLRQAMEESIELALNTVNQTLPHIQALWHFKAHSGLKDQMLVFLMLSEPLYPKLLAQHESFLDDLQHLSDSLFLEYSRRRDADLLNMDDLILGDFQDHVSISPMVSTVFQLRTGFPRSEQAWMLLRHCARSAILRARLPKTGMDTSKQKHSSKKRKMEHPVLDIIRDVKTCPRSERIATLQLCLFIAAELPQDSEYRIELLEAIMTPLSSNDAQVANWALMPCSCLAASSIEVSSSTSALNDWKQIWNLGFKALSIPSQCRVASHLLTILLRKHLVSFHDVADVLDLMLNAIDLSGPSGLYDSSCQFWCILLFYKRQYNPGSAISASEKVCLWLFKNWDPAAAIAKTTTKRAQLYETSDIVRIIAALLGSFHHESVPLVNMERTMLSTSEASLRYSYPLIRYLLLDQEKLKPKSETLTHPTETTEVWLLEAGSRTLLADIMDYLNAQADGILHSGSLLNPTANDKTSSELTRNATTLAVVSLTMLSKNEFPASLKPDDCRKRMLKLTESVRKYIEQSKNKDAGVNGVFAALEDAIAVLNHNPARPGAYAIARCYDVNFWRAFTDESEENSLDDLMATEESLDSQTSRSRNDTQDTTRSRQLEGIPLDSRKYRTCQKLRMVLALHTSQTDSDDGSKTIDDGFFKYIRNIVGDDLLDCRSVLEEIFEANLSFTEKATNTLLEHIGVDLLTKDEYELSEPAHTLTIAMLRATVHQWLRTDSEARDTADQLYTWFVTVPMPRRLLAPTAEVEFARLLQRIMETNAEYGTLLGLEAPRQLFLRIFEECTSSAKFSIGQHLPQLFKLFILKEHDIILDDIFTSLPVEPDSLEATAVRLHIMLSLGSAWPTLLRRSLYAIVEAPAIVPRSAEYARFCFGMLTENLGLSSPAELYALFAPQIIYTWLDSRSPVDLPYELFGFNSLKDFLNETAAEIAAQLVMRGREHELDELSVAASITTQALLQQSFPQAAAYCLGRDASIRPEVDKRAANGMVRLKKLLGKELFVHTILGSMAEILLILFKIADREDSFNRGFERHQSFSATTNAYEEIVSSGASQAPLDVSQQPSFKASSLMDEIEFLCGIADANMAEIWSPAMYTYVFLGVVSMIQPALGSLYTCTVIRRVRILISMVGDAALKDYPLEMTLHALRGLIADSQCAEDVIGICRYLLSHSKTYLQTAPGFLIGFAISTMVSLRAFIETPRESTTQESDHIATMTRAREFHSWLHEFLVTFSSPLLHALDLVQLRQIAGAAAQTRGAGSSRLGTPEGELLLGLLVAGHTKDRPLINDSAREAILEVLCAQFEHTNNYREDILGDNELPQYSVSMLLRVLLSHSRNQNLRLWISRVLGRAYAGSGPIMLKWSAATDVSSSEREDTQLEEYSLNSSRKFVLDFLVEELSSKHQEHVAVAEAALDRIHSSSSGDTSLSDCMTQLSPSLLPALTWANWMPATKSTDVDRYVATLSLADCLKLPENLDFRSWLREVCLALIGCCSTDLMLPRLVTVIKKIPDAAQKLFAPVLHMAILVGSGKMDVRNTVSSAFKHWMEVPQSMPVPCLKIALDAILYLRGKPLPQENTNSDRFRWLSIDYHAAARTAIHCGMYTTSLLFIEMVTAEEAQKGSRRASASRVAMPVELLLEVYRNIDEKDSFYGIQQPSTLSAMLNQLEFENAGFKSLSFRSAAFDSNVKVIDSSMDASVAQMAKLLNDVQLDGISLAMVHNSADQSQEVQDTMFATARKLEKWDFTAPSSVTTQPAILFKLFQDIHNKSDAHVVKSSFDSAFSAALTPMLRSQDYEMNLRTSLETFAILTEAEDVLSARGEDQITEAYERLSARMSWMKTSRYDKIKNLDSCRQTTFGMLSKSPELRTLTKLRDRETCIFHVRTLLSSSSLSRQHKDLQTSLNIATYLSSMAGPAAEMGAKVDVAIALEASHVLWDQGEMSPSIRVLQDMLQTTNLQQQDIPVGKALILAVLGRRISEARLEKADEVIGNYLKPAIKELKGVVVGSEAGQVFHEFAAFCDMQLQDPGNLEDLQRIESLRERKRAEVNDLGAMIKEDTYSKDGDVIKNMRSKAKRWFELDDREYQRLKEGREALLSQALENYLWCLKACDDYDNDALRFSALWLQHYEQKIANIAVKSQLPHVPSRKFASLMNQWTSRQQDDDSEFQKQLFNLIVRICTDHPYHGMYHIFTSSKGKGGKDSNTLSRNAAAGKIASKLKEHHRTGQIWIAIHNSNVNFVRFAMEKPAKAKEGAKLVLKDSQYGQRLEQDIRQSRIPPPTMKITIRPDCNYDTVSHIHSYQPTYSLASGISMPKIVTAVTSDGGRYKQLYKSGNDDLRQDAIMEQVFEQVSDLLKHHTEARQRNLGIRTYKVLPLTSTTGIIEFVTNTIPLNNYLIPAHQKHYPKDMKPSECRRAVADAANKGTEERIRTFRKICEQFHPVMRYFFTDRFLDPDDWFSKRLMFSRSTAAISMLGYILGLGDRHGQNILLDEKTGEVVHIDLGIAFETGRVLPIPEVVPFRLTRDLVDGMGITGTEGVFRRCCEFMLEALRKEEYSIMTILDVLRYDPLYNWSVSPLRMRRMEEDQKGEEPDNTAAGKIRDKTGIGAGVAGAGGSSGRKDDEAERALTVVRKKLSKSLSVSATVNELIQQATDPRNLAVLFAGWAAYL